ncbi:MAG: hypothetical protein E6868_04275 [Pantoea sp.]|uniref:hypothetical protein n=1 Tax=Pantoea TaxID=53335 RepID=UPI0028AFCCCC|nr:MULTISPECIES: hypothetical protein [Pantoea]MDU1572449.1 hypothetical protein [Pantoea sp.]
MYYKDDIISYLQSNNILALKLDHALTGTGDFVSHQIDMIGAGAKRALYYTSCFTDEYQDVCHQQKNEDVRFQKGVVYLLQHGNVVYDMLKIYFEEVFKYKTNEQLDYIKKRLMAVNVHIAASYLTNAGFTLAVASAVAIGMNLSLNMSVLIGNKTAGIIGIAGIYGIVQKAAESAYRLHYTAPDYYTALYAQELEMMYFLIEPLFVKSEAFKNGTSDHEIINIIKKMID